MSYPQQAKETLPRDFIILPGETRASIFLVRPEDRLLWNERDEEWRSSALSNLAAIRYNPMYSEIITRNYRGPTLTIEDWLYALPEPIRSQALHNMNGAMKNELRDSLADALRDAFIWDETDEYFDFWDRIHDDIKGDNLLTVLESDLEQLIYNLSAMHVFLGKPEQFGGEPATTDSLYFHEGGIWRHGFREGAYHITTLRNHNLITSQYRGSPRTALEWFGLLPGLIRQRAIDATRAQSPENMSTVYSSLRNALESSFTWRTAREGSTYWTSIRVQVEMGLIPSGQVPISTNPERQPEPTGNAYIEHIMERLNIRYCMIGKPEHFVGRTPANLHYYIGGRWRSTDCPVGGAYHAVPRGRVIISLYHGPARTALEWFGLLPKVIRERAIAAVKAQDESRLGTTYDCLPKAIDLSTAWNDSAEGPEYWNAVYDAVNHCRIPDPSSLPWGRSSGIALATALTLPQAPPEEPSIPKLDTWLATQVRARFKWAKFVAKNPNEKVSAYSSEPWLSKKKKSYWATNGKEEEVDIAIDKKWRDSLMRI
jgi:hypothetical protein